MTTRRDFLTTSGKSALVAGASALMPGFVSATSNTNDMKEENAPNNYTPKVELPYRIGIGGVPLGNFLRMVGADLSAKYVGFKCADDYYQSIDMASALHPQTIIALTWRDQVLPRKYGFPMKVRIPTKLGYKNPKYIMAMYVTNDYPGGYWEDQGYNWYGGS